MASFRFALDGMFSVHIARSAQATLIFVVRKKREIYLYIEDRKTKESRVLRPVHKLQLDQHRVQTTAAQLKVHPSPTPDIHNETKKHNCRIQRTLGDPCIESIATSHILSQSCNVY